jgi:pimeloyl-ACP methyl ester carboxylesterase
MIGFLEERGYRFGGVIQPLGSDIKLPECLDKTATRGDARAADFFSLQFSRSANTDGLTLKALELADCLQELRRFTGCEKLRIVAHSAGGLVARVYLQDALPKVKYAGDVDRLVTISTPHLGSNMADLWGEFLGTRATSLQTNAELILRLNRTLSLPRDVNFASIVVRGIGCNLEDASAYDHLVDHAFVESLPLDFRAGDDQVVHVRTQNLRLAETAKQYEARTGRPVQYVFARVPTSSTERVHTSALDDSSVQVWTARLIREDATWWTGLGQADLSDCLSEQARLCALGIIEKRTLDLHFLSNVTSIDLSVCECVGRDGDTWRYRFSGTGNWRGAFVGINTGRTPVAGRLKLKSDTFGRITSCDCDFE